ncbi:DUF1254 domain-containing protein [Pseudomonadota bacterium]
MNKELTTALLIFLSALGIPVGSGQAAGHQSAVTDEPLKRSRMVETVIWSTPFAAIRYFRDAYYRAAKADYNDVAYMSRPMEPNIQWLTPNQQVLYTLGLVNLKKHGPVVMEIPAKGEMLLPTQDTRHKNSGIIGHLWGSLIVSC